ncbi:eukaryotic-like serine/threonine-protein kinase [Candidatus Planktophila limnetica]|uniref:non-specific serine/threonine protein kinase n=1 Tax=Candidatus Planktophila limnetica TaxID=573600 RepID=A0A249LFZ8_9ACTN|nr:Stk1 family PASTA domain-containing Ser/Thr kinase [Candidatus Planktophila limnetica]ASY27849.1 eukaryotic-like serine/threonine-protein kinase [Candidatus Planktophila limnetica]
MSDLSGELIDGRYQLISQIAQGGMASIYSALDTRLDRKVAVKIMHPHLAQDEAFVNRFIREAKAAAALTHPNAVSVQDQGWNTNGVPAVFIVMEMVEGNTLREYLEESGKFGVAQTLQYLTAILGALAAAHKLGIIHRDIKPENILISHDGRIKIADFGLAHGTLIGSTLTAESSVVLGSVSYLSPEQVQRGISDSRSDVYSTGILAYELLVGEKPFSGDSPIQIAYMHVNNRVPRVSQSRSDVPKELDELIYSATSSNPDERPRDAGVFLAAIQDIARSIDPKRNQLSLELDIPMQKISEKPSRSKMKKTKAEAVKEITQEKPVRELTAGTKRRISKRVRRNRIIAMGLAVAVGIASWYVIIGPGSRIVVPSVVGASVDEANAALSPLGLTSIVTEKRFDEDIAAGKILESDPSGGGKVDAGGEVKLVISKGQERYVIPVLTGLTPEVAIKTLTKQPLKSAGITEEFNSTIPKGLVISSNPSNGQTVKRDTPVTILVSKGIEEVALTTYVQQSGDQAQVELTEAGFNVESSFAYSETIAAGAVISQTPAGLVSAPKGSTITLVVSKGSKFVFIPNVYSIETCRAAVTLKDLGLKYKVLGLKVKLRCTGTKTDKKVTNVSPKVGAKVLRGTVVTITVG